MVKKLSALLCAWMLACPWGHAVASTVPPPIQSQNHRKVFVGGGSAPGVAQACTNFATGTAVVSCTIPSGHSIFVFMKSDESGGGAFSVTDNGVNTYTQYATDNYNTGFDFDFIYYSLNVTNSVTTVSCVGFSGASTHCYVFDVTGASGVEGTGALNNCPSSCSAPVITGTFSTTHNNELIISAAYTYAGGLTGGTIGGVSATFLTPSGSVAWFSGEYIQTTSTQTNITGTFSGNPSLWFTDGEVSIY